MTVAETIQSKIFDQCSNFSHIAETWKEAGEVLVFTNGCFDLVHRGHVDSLAKAAALGTKLIVGINSDKSVKKLKGSNRPVLDQQSRATLLASMLMVDAVVIFDEDTPYHLICQLKPDVLVKGSEYNVDEIAGSGLVLDSGGRVERIELTKGFSTTGLIEKIKGLV